MRPVWGFVATALLLNLAWQVRAEGTSTRGTIKVQEAEVRSGHGTGPSFYATNKLRYGDTVEVTRELEDGWLEIMPPRQSFSWINARMLEQVGSNVWMVKGNPDQPVDVYFGSSVHEAKPDVRSTSVPVGSQVVSIAKAKAADDGLWLPIEPPPSERRYILAAALAKSAAPPRSPSTSGEGTPVPEGPGRPTSRTPTGAGSEQAAGSVTALVADAQKAEQAGDYGTAVKLWDEVASANEKTNANMALHCRSHAQWLRDRITSVAAGNGPMPRNSERIVPRPASGVGASNCVPTLATPCYNATSRSYSQGTAAEPNRESQPPAKTTRSGRLEKAAWSADSKPKYRLVSSDRSTYIYVLPHQDGIDLDSYVNRNVELEGTLEYHSEPRKTYFMATAIKPLQ